MNITKIIHHLRHYMTLNNAVLGLAIVVVLGWLWGTVGSLQKNFALQEQVDDLDQQIQIAEIENANLDFARQYYASTEYLELRARERLGKAFPGEHVILLPPTSSEPTVASPAATAQPVEDVTNFKQWMRFFFGNSPS